MGDLVEHRELDNGYSVSIFCDTDCEDPRHWDGAFLWLGFPHRHYSFGDETIDPERIEIDCPACKGLGYLDDDTTTVVADCERCGSTGAVTLDEWSLLEEWCRKEHQALVIRPVSVTDHSGLYFNLGGPQDPWDSGLCGVMLFTEHHVEAWGNTDWTEDGIIEQMKAELEQHEEWGLGSCYGYVIEDRNGNEVDSCWGYVGDDAIDEAVKAATEDLPAPPPKLYTIRLTADEIHALRLGLDAVDHGGHDNNPIIAADLKLRTVLDRISNDD
jgi:hypothetical protein